MMKKIIMTLIILAFLLIAVKPTDAIYVAPNPVCVVTGYVDLVEKQINDSTNYEYYEITSQILTSKIFSGQQYGTCEEYPGTDRILIYSKEDFTLRPVLTGQQINGRVERYGDENFTGIRLWDVTVIEKQDYNFTYSGFDGIFLNDETAIKGYTMDLFESNFLFGITPNLLTGGGEFEFKEVKLLENHGMNLPNGYTFASKIMEFDIKSKDKYDPARPFWLQVKYNEDSLFTKSIFYFDQGKGLWMKIPSKININTGYVRAAFHLPFAKLAVLENSGVMHAGVASWYAYKNCDCAASPDYPKGTKLRVTNIDNGKEVIVTVNDWGPERDIFPDRVIDLDVVAFEKIANKSLGLCHVEVVPYYE